MADDAVEPEWHHRVLQALQSSPCVVVRGETGCGKTTKLPQLLIRAGYGRVCVTQPRRVAALAAARRVAQERGAQLGGEVGYAIRFEQKCTEATRIKFVTDGVLLREALSSPGLTQYSAIVLDEAHERSLNTDVCFALTKRILATRQGDVAAGADGRGGGRSGESSEKCRGLQRLIVSSATLEADKFSAYFFDAPVVEVRGKAFPVKEYHVERPLPSDSARLEAALELAMRLHLERPSSPGHDILLFLTGTPAIVARSIRDRSEISPRHLREWTDFAPRSGGGWGEIMRGDGAEMVPRMAPRLGAMARTLWHARAECGTRRVCGTECKARARSVPSPPLAAAHALRAVSPTVPPTVHPHRPGGDQPRGARGAPSRHRDAGAAA